MLSSVPWSSADSGLIDRHEAVVEQLLDDRGVDGVDVADESVVHRLAGVGELDRRTLVRADQARVDAADADRVDVHLAAERQQLGVDEAVEHHGGGVDGLLVGDAPALHHARGHAQRLGDFRELRTAAVHEHHAHAEVMKDGDLLDEAAHGGRVGEHAAAGLHDEGLALVHADVGRRAAQAADGGGGIGAMHDHAGSSVRVVRSS